MRRGESFIYEIERVHLIEPRRGPRISRRSGDAFTVALAKGFYYTATGGKTVSEEPEDELKIVDSGSGVFTNQRVVFVGAKFSREWDFSKLTGWENMAGGNLMMGVSNRQKVSGITLQDERDLMPVVVFQIAKIARDDGWEAARESCIQGAANAKAQRDFVRKNTWVSSAEIDAYVSSIESTDNTGGGPTHSSPAAEHPSVASPSAATNATSTPNRLKEIEVTGEEQFALSFLDLRQLLGSSPGASHIIECELVADGARQKSEKPLVSVFIRDRLVGYVANSFAIQIRDALENKKGSVTLGGEIHFTNDDSKPAQNRVTIFLDSRLQL